MKSLLAVYPGSFDPPTNGHLDIIVRADRIFPKLIVAVTNNSNKKTTFSLEERYNMLKDCTKNLKNVKVEVFSDLLVKFVARKKANVIIRGLREMSDFEYEFQLALMNRKLDRKIETVFLMPDESYIYISSSLTREIARLGGSLKGLVPPVIEGKLKEHYSKSR